VDQRFQAFIRAAETLNMSKAAQLLFVSHQCVSEHIRSLEKEYGIKLFTRKPRLELTAEGEKLLETLYEIRILENNIQSSLKGSHEKILGKVSLGLPMSRYTVMACPIVAAFQKEFPNVKLEIFSDFSSSLQRRLERGALDMAITVQQEKNQALQTAALMDETFLCLVPDRLLRQYFPLSYPECISRFKSGIELEDISRLPLVQCPPASRLRCAMDRYSDRYGTPFSTVFESNRIEAFDSLTRRLPAAGLIPPMMYPLTERENRTATPDDYVHVFPANLAPLDISLNLSLVYHKSAFLPDYKKYLFQVIRDLFEQYRQIADAFLPVSSRG
jgi:DNA-binding transcriptional LysR family regulator